jgi:hypothetical protein
MTDLEAHVPPIAPVGRPERPVRTARPVRRFVVAQVVLAVLFGALWWSGLVAPRLGLGSTSEASYNHETGRATLEIPLRNHSPLAVEVRRVVPGDGQVTIESVRIDGVDIARAGQRVAGGHEATMLIELTCGPIGPGGPPPMESAPWVPVRLEITARAPIGLERTRTTSTVELPTACFG